MNIRKHTLVLALTLAFGSSAALAQGMMGGSGSMGPHMMQDMMSGERSAQGERHAGMGDGGKMQPMMGGGAMSMPCPMMDDAHMSRVHQMLDDEQRSEVRELMHELRPAQFERMGRMMNLRDDLMDELSGDRPDPDAVRELHGRMAELHGEMLAERVRMNNALRDVLTEEQREKLEEESVPSDVNPEDHEAHH